MSIEKFAEAMKGLIVGSVTTAYAQGRQSAVFQEYLNMGLSEEEAQKAYSANISPETMRHLLYSDFKLLDTLDVSPRYQIPVSSTKREIPKPKRRKNRLKI